MDKKFAPSINGVSFVNPRTIYDWDGNQRVAGDLALNGEIIGVYNPVHVTANNVPEMFLRLDDQHQNMLTEYAHYQTYFDNKNVVQIQENSGFGVLCSDLEILYLIYQFWITFNKDDGTVIGVINGDVCNVVQCKKPYTDEEFLKEISEQWKPIDPNKKTVLLKHQKDFEVTVNV